MVSNQDEGSIIPGTQNQNGANERCLTWLERRCQFLSDFGLPAPLRFVLDNAEGNRC